MGANDLGHEADQSSRYKLSRAGGVSAPQSPSSCPPSPLLGKRSHRVAISAPAGLNTEGGRKIVLKDLQEQVPLVDVDFFFKDGILPDLAAGIDLGTVLASPEVSDEIDRLTGKWKAFKDTNCWTQVTQHEDKVFAPIQDIITKIRKATHLPDTQATLRYDCRPNNIPTSNYRDNNSRPDSYGILFHTLPSLPEWVNIAVPGEFKKGTSAVDVNDNWSKIIWSMFHIMREDPRRRFVIAFTIEHTSMRLWFASRSDVFASLPFDFTTDHKRVAEFFLRTTFAKPDQLGWDETVTRRRLSKDPKDIVYDLEVGDTTYRTQTLLSNKGVEYVKGRGTRVWTAKKLQADGSVGEDTFVLKDTWVDADRKREGEIMTAIRAAAAEKIPKQKKVVSRLLLTLEQSWEVPVNGVVDHTHNLMRRGKTPTVQEIVHVRANAEECKKPLTKKPIIGGVYVPQALGEKLLQYPAKVHYRIVYKEVGKTIDQLDSMHDVFRCLCDIVKGLYAMHAAGYVHRDISAGNILVVDGKGRLGDVEYAKEEGDNSQHEVRTGTAYFMAIEVDEHAYVHTTTVKPLQLNVEPNILEDDSDSDSDSDDIPGGQADDVLPTYTANSDTKHTATSSHLDTIAEEDSESESSQQGQGDWVVDLSPQPEFQYNPLHDLESVWWVAVYVWLCSFPIRNDPKMDQTAWNEKLTAHARLAARVFHEVSFRRSFLTSEKILTTHSAALLPSFRAIGVHLEVIRATLMATYLHVEKDLSTLDFRAAKYAYTDILKSLTTVQKSLAGEKDIRIAFTDTRAMDAYLGGKPAHPNIIDAVNDTNLNNSEDADDDNGNSRPSKLFKSQHSRTVSLGAASSARWL